MTRFGARALLLLALAAAIAGCAGGNSPRLLNLKKTGPGPDEFSILPSKPLQAPEDFAYLPEPTPGGANLVDPTPNADAIAALGGRQGVTRGVPSSDAGLVSHASRYGVSGTIRQQLATEDLEWRRRNDGRLLERLFRVSVYFRAYRQMSLNQYRELERFRAAGVRTPAAPPEPR